MKCGNAPQCIEITVELAVEVDDRELRSGAVVRTRGDPMCREPVRSQSRNGVIRIRDIRVGVEDLVGAEDAGLSSVGRDGWIGDAARSAAE